MRVLQVCFCIQNPTLAHDGGEGEVQLENNAVSLYPPSPSLVVEAR